MGGVAFAVELMLPLATAPSLLVVAFSCVTARYIVRGMSVGLTII